MTLKQKEEAKYTLKLELSQVPALKQQMASNKKNYEKQQRLMAMQSIKDKHVQTLQQHMADTKATLKHQRLQHTVDGHMDDPSIAKTGHFCRRRICD